MKSILINNAIYVLNENIVNIRKEAEVYSSGAKYYSIVFEYIDGRKEKEYFEDKESRDFTFDEIYTIMKEKWK